MMADHQHVEMFVDRVDRERTGGVGRRGDDVGEARQLDDVRRMPAARAFGVEGVDGAALEGGDSILDEAALVQRVGMDHHLDVHPVGDRQAAVDRSEEHTSELQSLMRNSYAVFCLKKKKQ